MHDVRDLQREHRNRHVEGGPVLRLELITAFHRADRGGDHCSTGIAKAGARLDAWFLTNDADPTNLLSLAIGVTVFVLYLSFAS